MHPSASLEMLRRRADLLHRLRLFFHQRGYWEAETPALSADTVVDRHLDPLSVTVFEDPQHPEQGRRMWLQTSPEFAMKRLLAAGAEAIFQVARVFRGGRERGRLHNPEFTLLEWYRVGQTFAESMQFLAELAEAFLPTGEPTEFLTYRQAFLNYLHIDPHQASAEQLREVALQYEIAFPESLSLEDRDSWLELLLGEKIEPHLGAQRPLILSHYPASQAALARVSSDDPNTAERFELYFRGVELANGYHELLDPRVLRERNALTNRQRIEDGKSALPEESYLLEAMERGLPACCGVALGVDRLAMLALGAETIDEVLAFALERA